MAFVHSLFEAYLPLNVSSDVWEVKAGTYSLVWDARSNELRDGGSDLGPDGRDTSLSWVGTQVFITKKVHSQHSVKPSRLCGTVVLPCSPFC